MSLLPLHHIAYERVGASHKRTNPSNEEGLDREVGAKILEQARFEATTSSAASTVCAEMISLGKRPCTYHPLIGCMLVPVVMSYSLIGDMTAGCD